MKDHLLVHVSVWRVDTSTDRDLPALFALTEDKLIVKHTIKHT